MSKRLVIGIDVRDLKVAQTGTKTYLEELCKVFKNMDDTRFKFIFFDNIFPIYSGSNKALKFLGHLRYQFWKQVSLPLKAWVNGTHILFCTDNIVPIIHLGFKTVPVFHDAFFFENPEHFSKIWLKITLATAIPAARRSPIVITPSNYAKQQIHKYTQIPLEKMPVIYEGPKTLKEDSTQNSSIKGNYILHVGVMNKRKNIPALIYAFKKLRDKGYKALKLVLVGKIEDKKFSDNKAEIQNAIEETGLKNEVILTGYLSDDDLAALYSNASLYVFPSLNEGFGIPILEAFKYNLPVLVANNTSLPEIGGNAVITFNPFDAEDISDKMKMVLDNPELRKSLIEKGKQRLEEFSWEKTAQSLLKEFERIR
ncbi:glycosyltransferase family 4 protein [Pedobacter jamesrossensis]|uniref:Glycosyltransferase family 4 protein n=1 Tax=Pedobacter jamesrossensis TaxID=1908238 RepID=A0ABV8NTE9_9SPHI